MMLKGTDAHEFSAWNLDYDKLDMIMRITDCKKVDYERSTAL